MGISLQVTQTMRAIEPAGPPQERMSDEYNGRRGDALRNMDTQ